MRVPEGWATGHAYEQRPITALRGVGEALAQRLARLGVTQVQDLLFVLPLRYEDRTTVVRIGSLLPGMRAVVEGEIQLAQIVYRRRRQLQCSLSDGSGFLTRRFFHFSASQQQGSVQRTAMRWRPSARSARTATRAFVKRPTRSLRGSGRPSRRR